MLIAAGRFHFLRLSCENNWAPVEMEFVVYENSHVCRSKFEVTEKNALGVANFFFVLQIQHNSYNISNSSLQLHKTNP